MTQYNKEYYEAHKEGYKAYSKEYYEEHKEERIARVKSYNEAHKEELKAYKKAYYQSHKDKYKEYKKNDVNSFGQAKANVRRLSRHYLSKHGKKIPGYEIHHCCTYDEPHKFIYCSKEMHKLIHAYLREHNIDADSNHYEQIKHLFDETVVLYGV